MGKRFFSDGYIFTQCITRNGIEICKPDGKYYKFLAYTKAEKQKTSSDEDIEEVSEEV